MHSPPPCLAALSLRIRLLDYCSAELASNVRLKWYEAIRPNLAVPFAKPAGVRFIHGIHCVCRRHRHHRRNGSLVLIVPLSYFMVMRYAANTPLGSFPPAGATD